ncbi:MAG: hypothetical protein QT03_C0001G0103 [archaeon GW2011_AR10]|nr:MAG: hypothetical protein QT03_C0001G0103 [archaeon GW2011_AR10]
MFCWAVTEKSMKSYWLTPDYNFFLAYPKTYNTISITIILVLVVHKMCPRCGVVFEVKSDPVFCSEKCKRLFSESSLGYLKGRPSSGFSGSRPARDGNTEVTRPKRTN